MTSTGTRAGMGAAMLALALAAVMALVVASSPPAAEAYVTPRKCGTVFAKGREFAVRSHLVRCRFARRASRSFLRYGRKPDGWSCRRYSPRVTRIAFVCRRGQKDFYAIRR